MLKSKKARGIHTFPSHCKILKNKIYNTPALHIHTLFWAWRLIATVISKTWYPHRQHAYYTWKEAFHAWHKRYIEQQISQGRKNRVVLCVNIWSSARVGRAGNVTLRVHPDNSFCRRTNRLEMWIVILALSLWRPHLRFECFRHASFICGVPHSLVLSLWPQLDPLFLA